MLHSTQANSAEVPNTAALLNVLAQGMRQVESGETVPASDAFA